MARLALRISLDRSLAAPAQAAVLGIAHALSFAPWNLWWLQLVALAGLFSLAFEAPRPRSAALLGFAFGLGWFATGIWWVYISMHVYGQMWAWLAALATLAFATLLSLYPAAALWLAHRFVPATHVRLLLALPALWGGCEYLRGVLFTGFPWIVSGYAHTDGPLAAYAPIVGVYGVTVIAAAVSAAAVAALRFRARTRIAAATTLAALLGGALVLAGHDWTRPVGEPIRVRLVQGNIAQDTKFEPQNFARIEAAYSELLARPGRFDLVVLPESAYPVPLAHLPDEVMRQLLDIVRGGAALIFGIFIEDPPGHYFNSAVGLAPGRPGLQRYSKRHLVPFGEFIPFGFRWFVDLMQMPIGDQERGARLQAPMMLAGQRIAVNICYEDLFGAEIILAWADPQRSPTLLLNLSNLAWFDDSIALPQHLQMSRMRARETGRPMLRATNTGATAIVGPRGEVLQALDFNVAGVLDGEIRGYTGETPFVRHGNVPALAAILGLAVAAFWLRRRV